MQFSKTNPAAPDKSRRILARQLARELTKEELAVVGGGGKPNGTSSSWSSSADGADDGGADD